MKKKYIYISVIAILAIILIILGFYSLSLDKKETVKINNRYLCKKQNNKNKDFDEEYIIDYNEAGLVKKVTYNKIFKNIDEKYYKELKDKEEFINGKRTSANCNYNENKKELICSRFTSVFKNKNGVEIEIPAEEYKRTVLNQNYICE